MSTDGLKPGIYEMIINAEIAEGIAALGKDGVRKEPLENETSTGLLCQYIASVVYQALRQKDKVKDQVDLANRLIADLAKTVDSELDAKLISLEAEKLIGIINTKSAVVEKRLIYPQTSLVQSALFTGSGEFSLSSELKKEILSSNGVDMLVSFVRMSGFALIRNDLAQMTGRGGKLRVICTTYMGATDPQAIATLASFPNTEIHISFDTKHTRLHAKAYIFHRDSGFDTAYIGSSNLSNAAITDGCEWNVKLTSHDQGAVFDQMDATFSSYWANVSEFEPYEMEMAQRLENAINAEKYKGKGDAGFVSYAFDIAPYPFQEAILDRLKAEREVHGSMRNLVVAATGTGKTAISAFDYRNFARSRRGKVNSLLFVAHREEILCQSLSCFRCVLKDPSFGSLMVGTNTPEIDRAHLFVSIQTFNSRHFAERLVPDYFDYIVVDEFHHAAAKSYQSLLSHFRPQVLLGLTATPERMDGKSILSYFDNRVAADIRLPEAIDRQLLCPFHYFGLTDTVDLSGMKWSRGGYDRTELSNVYTLSTVAALKRAEMILSSIPRYVASMQEVVGLGFCVSVEHAAFMASFFSEHGVPSLALSGDSPDEERKGAKDKLIAHDLVFLFVVDLYNEGVDIPEVNTVLFLRPTESLTVFLQQLGRGLRIAEGKDCLTVLDYIGQANRKYNFEEKFSALLEVRGHGMKKEIEEGFVSVPRGCYIELEKVAKEYVLANIRSSYGSREALKQRLVSFVEDSALPLTLPHFLSYSHLSPSELYRVDSFSRLCVDAGLRPDFHEELEAKMHLVFRRIARIDSRRFISFLLRVFSPDWNGLESEEDVAMAEMFRYTLVKDSKGESADRVIKAIKDSPVLSGELTQLLAYRLEAIDFIDKRVDIMSMNPLDLYCTYTKDQVVAGLGYAKPEVVRQGVFYIANKKTDIFFITLQKGEKEFSPTTCYDDYAIDAYHFHWQSQSTTSDSSPTGMRYIHHQGLGSTVLLFVRETKNDSFGTCPFTFLGKARHVSHKGSKPMSIIWELEEPIPARFIKRMSRAMIG